MVVTFIYFKLCFAGLLAGMSRADRVSTGIQPAAGSASRQHQRTKMCGQWCRPVLHSNGCERYQHLNPLIAMVGNGPRLQQKGVKVVTGVKASMAGISSQSCWCPCVPGWNQVSFFSVILETRSAFDLTKRETPTTAAADECGFQLKLHFLSEYVFLIF